jgi:DNA end-binding protein Ku
MSERPIWRGHLRLALVSCPVAIFSARGEDTGLHFDLLNPETGNRVHMVTEDAETGRKLSRGDLVKGYEFRKHTYVTLTDEDFACARIESSATLTIGKFVPENSIDAIYFEGTYFMKPDGDAGVDVYLVLRDAIARTRRMALSRLVLANRERAVAISASGRGLLLHTLHGANALVDPEAAFADLPDGPPDPDMVALAVQLIDRQTGEYDPADQEDRYEARLRAVIDAKLKGEGLGAPLDEAAKGGAVIDLMAALKSSLRAESAPTRRASRKAGARKPSPEAARRRNA